MVKISPGKHIKRRIRRTKKGAALAQDTAARHINRHIVRRWRNLSDVRRFVAGWLALVAILTLGVWLQSGALAGYYMERTPAYGGTYFEGVSGEFSTLNPIFATSLPDTTVSKLVFSSLLKYDRQNNLVGDIAEKWSVDKKGVVYTVNLSKDIYWHDGQKLTADDVVFTYEAIQDQDTKSPLAESWRGVVVQALDEYTVSFSLPNQYSPFLHSLTNGILPKHILGNTPHDELRSADFNQEPIGSGPFKFNKLTPQEDGVSQVDLLRNDGYYNKPPYLKKFVVLAYPRQSQVLEAFRAGDIMAAADLKAFDAAEAAKWDYARLYEFPMFNQVFAFLNNADPLLKDRNLRRAIVYATDKKAIFDALARRYPVSDSPLMRGQLGYDPKLVQPGYDLQKANKLLDKAGWKRGRDGIRVKGNKQLNINLVSQNGGEYQDVAAQLQKDWLKAGIAVTLNTEDPKSFTQSVVAPHNYQVLLFGISQGIDPDVYVYWHSLQAVKGGFNLANYKSSAADTALEAGRTRRDPRLRAEKYKAFLRAWLNDEPAVALYRPVFNYLARPAVGGVKAQRIVSPEDRFNYVNQWFVETKPAPKRL